MMIATIFCLLLVGICSGKHNVRSSCGPRTWLPDYYWRDYNGAIPDDAVEGGTDVSGNVTYIGQIEADYKSALPGVIYPGKVTIDVVYQNGVTTGTKYIRILCTQHKMKLSWVPIQIDNFYQLTKYFVVVGGIEGQTRDAYIGRINYENNIIVGRVFSPKDQKGLKAVTPNREVRSFDSFELLVYARD